MKQKRTSIFCVDLWSDGANDRNLPRENWDF